MCKTVVLNNNVQNICPEQQFVSKLLEMIICDKIVQLAKELSCATICKKSCPKWQFAKKLSEWQFAQKLSRTKFAKYLPRTKICNILVGKTNLQKSCREQQFAKKKLAGIKAYLEIYSVVCFGHPTTDFGSIWFKKRVNFNIFKKHQKCIFCILTPP